MRTVTATRFVAPLREGGSLPGLFEADDDGLYVVKFRGAGQGVRALVAELVAGGLGRALGLPVPELVLVELDPALAAAEPDPEVQDLIRASAGLNVGLDFLPGALAWDDGVAVDAGLAARVVWLDALTLNVDRTPRNPNLLVWHRDLYLIDHGAAVFVHHAGGDWAAEAGRAFPAIGEHVLLPHAAPVTATGLEPGEALVREVVDTVPREWAPDREQYATFLLGRLESGFAEEAERARG
jgi:hypothetical protein